MTADPHYDAIVVGSGFGGSVAAYRLAEAGLGVCVLERGKAYPPGSFPRSPREMAKNFWDPSEGMHGLFNVWSFRNLEAVVSSGLGGGSLIYANVLLRKDPRWFVQENPSSGSYEEWPINRDELEPHYDAVEAMVGVTSYPLDEPSYRDTSKTLAMRDAGGALGLQFGLPPLAITFGTDGHPPSPGELVSERGYPNLHGRTRLTCQLVGECDLGCNYGSKNSLDHTYLSAAKHHGAEIRVRTEVKSFAPRSGGGYAVACVEHTPDREGVPIRTDRLPLTRLTCDLLILAAGALGTPFLLLRNRHSFPGISPALGTRVCGNGDLLSFVTRATTKVGGRRTSRLLDASRGPVITSYLRVPDAVDTDEGGDGPGYYIEDAGFPGFLDWLIEGATAPSTAVRLIRFIGRRLASRITGSPKSDLSAEIGGLLGSGELSSASMPMLGMGRDVPDGVMRLRRGHLDLEWSMASSLRYFTRLDSTMAAVAGHLGGQFHRNPLWRFKRVITVHPLGGSPMGRTPSEGVVDPFGEVFNHPGLFVADGSVMPGPVGPNPALTIAAFADRVSDRIIQGRTALGRQRREATKPVEKAR